MRLALPLLVIVTMGAAMAEEPLDPRGGITDAAYADPTSRYDHGILGDATEWGALDLAISPCLNCASRHPEVSVRITLPQTRVFEDIAPRLADLDQDGKPEVIVVESDLAQGASLAVYGPLGKITATPFIGQTHRWLAPVGAADIDGDGAIEIAYVDRPHLAQELVILRYADQRLIEIARLPGLTNHRIGDSEISGGMRACDGPVEMILLTPDWSRIQAVRLLGGSLRMTDIAANTPENLRAALTCR